MPIAIWWPVDWLIDCTTPGLIQRQQDSGVISGMVQAAGPVESLVEISPRKCVPVR